MFELREKFEKVTFWPFLTPEKRKVVHCICFAGSVVLSRQNLKSGMPDFRFQLAGTENPAKLSTAYSSVEPDFWQSPPVEPDFRKTGHDPQNRLNFVAKKVKNDCEKKSLSPNPYGHGHFAKNGIQIGHF